MSYRRLPISKLVGEGEMFTYLLNELDRLSDALESFLENPVRVYHAEPRRIQNLVVAADGTDWNPGGGAGLYFWDGAAWTKL